MYDVTLATLSMDVDFAGQAIGDVIIHLSIAS